MEDRKDLVSKITRLSQYHCVNSCQVIIDEDNIKNELCLVFEIKSEYYRQIQRMIEDEDSGVFDELLQRLSVDQTTLEIHIDYIVLYPNVDISTRIQASFRTSCNTQHIYHWLKIMYKNIKIIDETIDFYVHNCYLFIIL